MNVNTICRGGMVVEREKGATLTVILMTIPFGNGVSVKTVKPNANKSQLIYMVAKCKECDKLWQNRWIQNLRCFGQEDQRAAESFFFSLSTEGKKKRSQVKVDFHSIMMIRWHWISVVDTCRISLHLFDELTDTVAIFLLLLLLQMVWHVMVVHSQHSR